MIRLRVSGILFFIVALLAVQPEAHAALKFSKVVFGCYTKDLDRFEAFVTHVQSCRARRTSYSRRRICPIPIGNTIRPATRTLPG